MALDPIVARLVLDTLESSSKAIAHHYRRLFENSDNLGLDETICEKLKSGDSSDLTDDGHDSIGFDHHGISLIFRNGLYPNFDDGERSRHSPGIGIDRHIWGADYDRHVRSLLPTGLASQLTDVVDSEEDQFVRRTRVSSIVQQSLLRSRGILQSEKATRRRRTLPSVFIPSPFFIAQQILADPAAPASLSYVAAALRIELRRRIEGELGPLKLAHETITRSLDLIRNRFTTSKRVRSRAPRDRNEIVFLCHHLASQGMLSLEIEWDRERREPVDALLCNLDNLFEFKSGRERGYQVSFRMHPDLERMPDPAELLNELEGLPLPIEGATPIFFGGLRFAFEGDIVAAISGPFGAGKTSACLSLAASLAPLGCRTLFLSCEESADAIRTRLAEAIPEHIIRSTPLFNCVTSDELRSADASGTWFEAHSLRVGSLADTERKALDVSKQIKTIVERAIKQSILFKPYRTTTPSSTLPGFARPIVIVDGLHQLFSESEVGKTTLERSLRELIDFCKKEKAVFIFTSGSGRQEMERLDYLCDLVITLERQGTDRPDEFVLRLFKILKARRQPAMIGAHPFHIAGPKAFRIKPNVGTHVEQSKSLRWQSPEPNVRIAMQDERPKLLVQNRSQTLVFGTGSSGKAGLGLYILNRRPLTTEQISTRQIRRSGADEEIGAHSSLPFYEARTLVISFLYQSEYYETLQKRLRTVAQEPKNPFLPDRMLVDVLSLYPGGLTPEDFLAKVENRFLWAELRGLPYTGVLIDGLHNVFVQFPLLQEARIFWPQLYNVLRRRALNVITTHTEFDLRRNTAEGHSLAVDFEHAQRKAAPLLSVLVSAADYVFELSAINFPGTKTEYWFVVRGMLGENLPVGHLTWDRQSLRLGGADQLAFDF